MFPRPDAHKKWFVYVLLDSRFENYADQVRYVGFTVNVKSRLRVHLEEASGGDRSHKANWIRQLVKENLLPAIRVIDQGIGTNWAHAERFYIKFFREEVGANLTNMTPGGDCGYFTPEAIRSGADARKGKPLSSSHRAKLVEARIGGTPAKGLVHDDSYRRFMSVINKGRVVSIETRQKLRDVHKTPCLVHTEEAKRKMSESHRRRIGTGQ